MSDSRNTPLGSQGLGSLPQLHPRHLTVQAARNDLMGQLLRLKERHGLTSAEVLWVLAQEFASHSERLVAIERRELTG